MLVVASGVYGLILQQYLPARMLAEAPSETINSQIPHVVEHLCQDAERLILAVCGPEETDTARDKEELTADVTTAAGHLTLGAVRTAGRVAGRVLETRSPGKPVPGSEPLRVFFRKIIRPYLRDGSKTDSPLCMQHRSAMLFQELRTYLAREAQDCIAFLEDLCRQRREFDIQSRLQFWLHSWLWLHLPLSVALLVLMVLHIVVALKYW
jgi:hypothetical protein